jgi:hypothetical protein
MRGWLTGCEEPYVLGCEWRLRGCWAVAPTICVRLNTTSKSTLFRTGISRTRLHRAFVHICPEAIAPNTRKGCIRLKRHWRPAKAARYMEDLG